MGIHKLQLGQLLHNLALLNDTLDLSDKERADAHCTASVGLLFGVVFFCRRTLFADQGVVAVIGIVCITGRGTAAITESSEVEFYLISVKLLDHSSKLSKSPRNSWPNRPECPELRRD